MEGDSVTSKTCLFCGTKAPSLPNDIVIKEEQCDPAAFSIPFPHAQGLDRLVEKQLKSVFIVRKLLDISEEKCMSYLQLNEGKRNPDSWFSICSNCVRSVEESYKIYFEIQRLTSKLEKIKSNLKSFIITQNLENNQEHGRSKCKENEKDFVYYDICNYVTEEKSRDANAVISRKSRTATARKTRGRPKGLKRKSRLDAVSSYKRGTTVETSHDTEYHIPIKKGKSDCIWCRKNDRKRSQSQIKCSLCNARLCLQRGDVSCFSKFHDKMEKEKPFHIVRKKGRSNCVWCRRREQKRRQTQITCKVCRVPLCLQKGDVSCFSKFHDEMKNKSMGRSQQSLNMINSDRSGTSQTKVITSAPHACTAVDFDGETTQLSDKNHTPEDPTSPVTYGQRLRRSTRNSKVSQLHLSSTDPGPERGSVVDPSEWKVDSPFHYSDDANDVDWNLDLSDEAGAETAQTNEDKGGNSNIQPPNARMNTSPKNEDICDKNSTSLQETSKVNTSDEGHEKIEKPKVKSTCVSRCNLCVAFYKYKLTLTKHMKLHSNNEGVSCPHCGWLCAKHNLHFHLISRHRKLTRKYKKRTRTKVYAKKNNNKVEEKIPYYCDFCHMIYTSKYFLSQHVYRHHPSKLLPCNFCDSTFESKQFLEIHCKEYHPLENRQSNECQDEEDQQSQQCEFCSHSFPSKLKKDYHVAKVHRDKLYICKICGHKSDKFINFLRHKQKKHSQEPWTMYTCEFCSKHLNSSFYLKRHMKQMHYAELGTQPIKCQECDVTFSSPVALQNHIDLVHLKIKQLCCEHCGKAFGRASDLKQHILLHTVPREHQYKQGPFYCKFCPSPGAKFNVRQGLYYHLKHKHSDKYSFICAYCGIGYATQNTLTQHERKCKGKLETPSKSTNVDMEEQASTTAGT